MSSWERNIRTTVPYTPGEQPKITNIIKLNTNENPYPPSQHVLEALEAVNLDQARRYPDPTAGKLVDAIAKYLGLPSDQVFVGVGSDDVLAMSFMTFFNSDKKILFPNITYSFYDVWADVYRIPYETKALKEDFSIDPEDYYGENGGIIFPNPNAPTGKLLATEAVEDIIRHNPDSVVIVDEAYIDFGGESVLPLISKYENLLVVQTFSKSRAMAGMRIGFAAGSRKLIKYLNDVKYSFNSYTMNAAAIEAGTASVEDEAYFREICEKIVNTRENAKKRFTSLGFSFPDSMANFLFVSHETVPARELFTALRAEGIIVRYFDKPGIDNYLRITIGTDEEMDKLFAFLETYLRRTTA